MWLILIRDGKKYKFSSKEYDIKKIAQTFGQNNQLIFVNEIPLPITKIVKNKEIMKSLLWPISYQHFNFMGRDYFLFGDRHNVTGNENLCLNPATIDNNGNKINSSSDCWNFDYFLTDLAERAVQEKRYIDYFTEIPYNISYSLIEKYKITYDKNHIIQTFNSPFIRQCFSLNKKDCPFNPYFKAHYVDTRFGLKKHKHPMEKDIIDFLLYFESLTLEEDRKKIINIEIINLYFKILFESDNYPSDIQKIYPTKNNDYYKLYAFKQHPIRKQYLKLKQAYIMVNGKNLADLVKNYIITGLDIKDFSLRIMDAYLLLRLFRSFTTQNEKSDLGIVYAGDLHIRFYTEFFINVLKCKLLSKIDNSIFYMDKRYDEIDLDDSDINELKRYMTDWTRNRILTETGISSIVHRPNLTSSKFNITINDLSYQNLSKEKIYGLILGFYFLQKATEYNVLILFENRKTLLNIENIFYILRIGAKGKYYLMNDNQIYNFNRPDFIVGLNTAYYICSVKMENTIFYETQYNAPIDFDLKIQTFLH